MPSRQANTRLPLKTMKNARRILWTQLHTSYLVTVISLSIIGIFGYLMFMSLVQRGFVETDALAQADSRMDGVRNLLQQVQMLVAAENGVERAALRATIERTLSTIDYLSVDTLAQTNVTHSTQIDEQRHRFAEFEAGLRELVGLPDHQVEVDHAVLTHTVSLGTDILHTEDLIVNLLIEARLRQLLAFHHLATLLLIIVLGSLFSLYVFIFRPMLKHVREKEEHLRREIDVRIQAEHDLRQSENLYRLLVDHLPKSAVLLFDREMRHTLTEGPSLRELGFPRERFYGKTLDQALPPDYVKTIRRHYEQALDGRPSELEGSVNGRLFHAQYLPLRDGQNRILGGLVLVRDVSDEKAAAVNQIALTLERERNKLLTDFVRDICHDFRTPLSVMSTNVFLIRRDTDSAKREQRLDTMQRQIDRLSRLLDQLVTIATLEMSADMVRQPTDPKSLLRILSDHYAPLAEASGLHFVTSPSADLPTIEINLSQIHDAIANLIDNALHFTAPGGTIQLDADLTEDDQLVISVSDTGSGIPEQDLPRVFDAFYRGDKSRSSDSGGAGLGLTIARRIVQMHGGDVRIDSRQNEGTRVSIYLPLSTSKVRTQPIPTTR